MSLSNETKLIQERIKHVEDHFHKICQDLIVFTRNEAKVRDKGDDMAKSLMLYADSCKYNASSQDIITEFAGNLAAVSDYRDVEVERLESKVIAPLKKWSDACKHTKELIKTTNNMKNKESKQKNNLDKVKDKAPSDSKQITDAENELKTASLHVTQSSHTLEEEALSFEKKKLNEFRDLLKEFAFTEMKLHAKALELYSKCHGALSRIDTNADLTEFANVLNPDMMSSRLILQQAHTKESTNKNEEDANKVSLNDTNTSSMYSVNASDEDDEEDEDDD